MGDEYEFGSYKGKNMAANRRVIVVEFNYRLGSLGFLSHPVGNRAWLTARGMAHHACCSCSSKRATPQATMPSRIKPEPCSLSTSACQQLRMLPE